MRNCDRKMILLGRGTLQHESVPSSRRFESPAALDTLGDALDDAFLLADAAQRIVVFNSAAESMFGFDRTEVLGEPLAVLIPDRYHANHEQHVNAFRSHGVGHGARASNRPIVTGSRSDGIEFPAEITLTILDVGGETMVSAVIRDVSAQVAAEQALSESEERFRVTFDHSPVAMALVNLEGRCIGANLAKAELTGYPTDVLVGMPMTDLVLADDIPILLEGPNRVFSGRSTSARLEIRQRNADASVSIVDWSLALVVDSTGSPRYTICQAVDVTERVRSRVQLEKMLASKNELIASVSHELRTPLTVLVGFAQLLHDEHSPYSASERSEMIQAMVTESVDMTNIVEDLVVAAKAETDALTVVQVSVDLRAQVAQVVEAWTGKEVDHIELVGSGARGTGDPSRVRQILRNLLSNALRYGGERVTIRVGSNDTVVRVEVSDNGSAIPLEDQERIFQPYQRAHKTVGLTQSLGLGLAISRRLAELMNGTLFYERDRDENRFVLTLPKDASDG